MQLPKDKLESWLEKLKAWGAINDYAIMDDGTIYVTPDFMAQFLTEGLQMAYEAGAKRGWREFSQYKKPADRKSSSQ